MSLSTIGSIAIFINETFQLTTGISGNMVEIVDQSRQNISNYTGVNIGSNSIDAKYQPVILDFVKADTIDLIQAQSGGEKVKLAELSIDDSGDALSAKSYRLMGEMKLKNIGKTFTFVRSLS